VLTYSEEFDSLHFWDGTSGLDTRPGWAMHWWADQGFAWTAASRTWYVQPSDPGGAPNPFNVENGVLTISARKSDTVYSDHKGTYDYTSGVISTFHDFQQTYGYFEIRAKLTLDAGTLPAFWLLPADGVWPPELDVMEIIGGDPTTLYGTVHSQVDGQTVIDPTHRQTSYWHTIPDAGDGFHTYGVDWQADKITWYFDGKPWFEAPTPSDMHGPMYLIANLNVGGTWEGYPDETKEFASDYMIDYIRVYDAFPGAAEPPPSSHTPPVPSITSVGGADGIVSALLADRLVTGTAAAGTMVRILCGDAELGRAVAAAEGGWSYTLTAQNLSFIGQGPSRGISATATDALGRTSERSGPFIFGIDQSSAVLTAGSDRVELSSWGGKVAATTATLGAGDVIVGGSGVDTLFLSGGGKPIAPSFDLSKATQSGGIVLSGFENIDASGLRAAVRLTGSASKNVLSGGSGADTINAGSGNDVIDGGPGRDLLYGGSGRDSFVFRSSPKKANADRIADFSVKHDSIWLDNAIFTKLGKKGTADAPAQMSKSFFTVGPKAKDKNDYVIYDDKRGVLYYDADGFGSRHKQVEIAAVKVGLHLTFKDFLVI